MFANGLVLNTLGIGLFCSAIFALAVYGLPFFVALSVGMLAFRHGTGVFGALLIGIASGALMLAAGQIGVAVSRSLALRVAIATAFAVPAAIAGYHVVFALSQIGVPSLAWRHVVACSGAACLSSTASARLTVFAKTRPSESVGVLENTARPVLPAATHE
ncbi:hypothetical protein ABIB94_006899 [Bradyrhizobium sp. JR7.2]|jgi:hypothetical protein|uniref:Major facilitator superfamily (MFS) profile domain-containing protein n=1 Tax=Bradyrhizobium barranii TaxID=2992140 RepID=A0ABY3QF18_9BRAD|nr:MULTISPECIES: hypothetical protein [Bradyrhizobium]UFW84554.1 hypothetical protein BjapCC829_32100 [Bradyrhizobium japonicum]WFT92956.1 hypothetical protein QA633_32200 [Bradyrhizobium barranii]